MNNVIEWFYNNETLIEWLLLVSFISFLVTLISIPVILANLPEDYFSFPDRHRILLSRRKPLFRILLFLVKNLLGAVLILAGILMLVLPGQGILTILIGLILMEYPGKFAAERWLITRPSVLHAINWIRVKAGKTELVASPDDGRDNAA